MFTDNLRIITASERVALSDVTYKMNFNENEGFLLYIKAGRGKISFNNTLYRVAKGSFVLCRSGDSIKYRFSKKYPVSAFFIKLSGDLSFFENGVHRCFIPGKAEKLLSEITNEFILKKPFFEKKLSGMLVAVLCHLFQSTQNETDTEKVLSLILKDIHENYLTDKIDINKYASMLGLSKDRVSVIFKKRFGYAPYKYQMMLKMDDATDMLLHTDLSVGEIAQKLGYLNQLYFSTAYKKQMGASPSEMRKRK